MIGNTITEKLKFHVQEAKFTSVEPRILVSKEPCFAMQWSSKDQTANSFAQQIGFISKSPRSKFLPVEYFGLQKVPNK